MLKSIHIKNFRSCKDVCIDDIGDLTVLVGRNGAGKTNILRAILWVAENATSTDVFDSDQWSSQENEMSVKINAELRQTQYRYFISVIKSKDSIQSILGRPDQYSLNEKLEVCNDKGEWINIINRRGSTVETNLSSIGNLEINAAMPCISFLSAALPANNTEKDIMVFYDFMNAIRYYPFDEPSDPDNLSDSGTIINHSTYQDWVTASKSGISPRSSTNMRLLHMYLEKEEKFTEVKNLLGPDGLNLIDDIDIIKYKFPLPKNESAKPNINTEEPRNVELFYFVNFTPSNHANDVSSPLYYRNLAAGTRRLLRIISSMILDERAVMLVEQPEDAIHTGLLHKLISLFRTYANPLQFVIASHSPGVFDNIKSQEVRLVTMGHGETQLRKLTDIELHAAEEFLNEEGSLSEFLEVVQED